MSTWKDDLKKKDPVLYQATIISGSSTGVFLKNMIKALEMHSWLNTAEDNLRLIAAKFVQRPTSKERRKQFEDAYGALS